MDLIRELKKQGHYLESQRLLKIYLENKKKNKIQLKKEILNQYNAVLKQFKKKYGVCIGCNKSLDNGKKWCIECIFKKQNKEWVVDMNNFFTNDTINLDRKARK